MEWTIPAKTFSVSNVAIVPPSNNQKPYAPLTYKDEDMSSPHFSLVLPPLPVKSYDSDTGKLILSLNGFTNILNKLLLLQNQMLQTIHTNYSVWFPSQRQPTFEEISQSFQALVHNNSIQLYCPLITIGSFNEVGVFSGSSWSKGVIPSSTFNTGNIIRVAVRLQSISFHQHHLTKEMTGRFRIQHRVLAIFTNDSLNK
jgi:hypothetical protein